MDRWQVIGIGIVWIALKDTTLHLLEARNAFVALRVSTTTSHRQTLAKRVHPERIPTTPDRLPATLVMPDFMLTEPVTWNAPLVTLVAIKI
jgi:hypothetical protein